MEWGRKGHTGGGLRPEGRGHTEGGFRPVWYDIQNVEYGRKGYTEGWIVADTDTLT